MTCGKSLFHGDGLFLFFRYNGPYNLCRAGKCMSSCTYTQDATATSVCSRYGNSKCVFSTVFSFSSNIDHKYFFFFFFFPPLPEKLKSPMTAKTFNTPLPSGRKALGTVNKKTSIPAINVQEKKLLKPQVGIQHAWKVMSTYLNNLLVTSTTVMIIGTLEFIYFLYNILSSKWNCTTFV